MNYTKGDWKAKNNNHIIQCGDNDIALLCAGNEFEANARLIAAAPDMLEALKEADKLIKIARQYFPKSIRNTNTFQLENACATIGKAIAKAEEK